ncbi:hypothetical protein MW887_000976 [Aspergillus wentii]|nr:hypothetical protein MW887_000976 [Aspergillus wentii]
MDRDRDRDNWQGVQDGRLRKKIQDRLAQRARRKRIAESKASSSPSSDKIPPSLTLNQVLIPTTTTTPIIGQVPLTVWAALWQNGAMMEISCSVCIPSVSKPVDATIIPASLHPTDLQLTTIHHSWIDRFPFPKMRDNMTTLTSVIDENEFLQDLFCMTI